MRTLTLTLCLALAGGAAAADLPIADAPILPGDVVSACLSPSLTERVSGLSWRVLTPEAWGRSIDVGESPDTLTLAQDGAAHPNGWVRTRVTVTQAPRTAANPAPVQTLTVTATPSGILPETTVVFDLLKEAALPPCTAKAWGGRPALVADAGDWFIIAGSPKAKLVRLEGEQPRWTLTETATAKGSAPVSASLRVGVGALPAEPAAE